MRRMREELSALSAKQAQILEEIRGGMSSPAPAAKILAPVVHGPPPVRSIGQSSKSLTGSIPRDPFFGASLQRVHPMFVIPVGTILAPSFLHFRSHEELKQAGHLVEYKDWMEESVLFVSHTWLRRSHPDNDRGGKFALLRAVLQRAVDGKLDINPHWFTGMVFKKAGFPFRMLLCRGWNPGFGTAPGKPMGDWFSLSSPSRVSFFVDRAARRRHAPQPLQRLRLHGLHVHTAGGPRSAEARHRLARQLRQLVGVLYVLGGALDT